MLTAGKLEKLLKPFIGDSNAVDEKDFGKARVVTFHNTGYVYANTRTDVENKTISNFKKIGYNLVSQPKNAGEYNFFLVVDGVDEDGCAIGTLELVYVPL